MPELPEVETVKRTLAERLTGVSIVGVQVLHPAVIKGLDQDRFSQMLKGSTFKSFARRGKFLLVFMDDSLVLVVHLRMTGRLVVTSTDAPLAKHTHVIWKLSSGEQLRFIDIRRFGTVYLLDEQRLDAIRGLREMGPEPLGEEFTLEYLQQKLSGRSRNIKALLLDQKVVAGIGNIYADEILAQAAIHPLRTGGSLITEEIAKIYRSIREILRTAIEHRGTTFRDYVDGMGQKGNHQHYLKVYQQEGSPCQRCGGILIKERIAGRGTYYCPECQK